MERGRQSERRDRVKIERRDGDEQDRERRERQ